MHTRVTTNFIQHLRSPRDGSTRRRFAIHRSGFTLFELLLALTITAIIGASIATMISSVSAGTAGQQDGRRFLVRIQSLQSRFATTIHSARAILDSGPNYLIYWTGDVNSDNAVELSEIGMLELDTTTNQLNQYTTVFPANYTISQIASADTKYAASSSWYSGAQAAKSTFFSPTIIATNVTAFTPTLDALSPANATTATCILTLSDGVVTRNVVLGATIRSHAAPQ